MGEPRAARVFDEFGDYVAPDDVACWSKEDVANWIDAIGYPQYVECFRGNSFNGALLAVIQRRVIAARTRERGLFLVGLVGRVFCALE